MMVSNVGIANEIMSANKYNRCAAIFQYFIGLPGTDDP